ncbi:MAG: rod shape-determining protein MreC [Thermodesulfovibrionales bacterium]
MQRKRLFLFLFTLTVLFVLMTYQSRRGPLRVTNPLGDLLNRSSSAVTSVGDFIARPFERISIREQDVRTLRKQVDELLLERSRAQEAMHENRRLRDLLQLRERTPNTVAAARVISRGIDHWQNSVVIDKGDRDGVGKNMTAMTPGGLAGKIFNTSGAFSTLLLLNDINFAVAVRLQESRREGVAAGTGSGKLVLKYIPYEDDVKTGDVLVTSGLDQLFPPGIPVGYISKIDKKGTTHFQEIEVTPYVDTKRMEEVIIVR